MRQNRLYSPNKIYHIIIRGINKQDIFTDAQDKNKFLNEINKLKEKYDFSMYAYVIMPNHVHLIIHDSKDELPKIMHSLLIRYSEYINKKYDRSGHLFQNRYKSKPIENAEYLKTAIRYIHYNPEKARIGKYNEYRWSSYQEYIQKNIANNGLINVATILKIFGNTYNSAIAEFNKFHNEYRETKLQRLENQIEFEIDNNIRDEDLIEYIVDELDLKNIYDIQKYQGKYREELIGNIFKLKEISALQVSRITGISRTTITNIRNKLII